MKHNYLEPCDIWEYYMENHGNDKGEIVCLAENSETGIEINMLFGTFGPEFLVSVDDDIVLDVETEDENGCLETAEKLYAEWIDVNPVDVINACSKNEESLEDEYDEEIEAREDELDLLVEDFVIEAAGCLDVDNEDYMDIIHDLKEHFLMYMHRKWGFDIYRPMILKDESGNEMFTKYPYEKLCEK